MMIADERSTISPGRAFGQNDAIMFFVGSTCTGQRRSLFAAITAEAIITGRPLKGMDALAMLHDPLTREIESFWHRAGIADSVSDPHVT